MQLARDKAGIAMVEFALVLPIMVLMFCGAWETSQAVICYMKLGNAADTVVDLATQQKVIHASNIDDFYTSAQVVMLPSSTTGLAMAIASVNFDATTGNAAIAWQQTRGGALPMSSATITSLSAGLGNKGDSVVIAQLSYTYTSSMDYVLPKLINLSSKAMQRPRLVKSIPFS
jgi:Flp pilus assembly protein TadG